MTNISRFDLPDPKTYQTFFGNHHHDHNNHLHHPDEVRDVRVQQLLLSPINLRQPRLPSPLQTRTLPAPPARPHSPHLHYHHHLRAPVQPHQTAGPAQG